MSNWTRLCRLLALSAVVALAGCTGLAGPRTIVLTEADLSRLIEKQFPLDRRVIEVFDIQVSAPRVALLSGSNRLATELDIRASERLSGRDYRGQLSIDYGLRYDERDQTVRMTQVRVQSLQLEGGSSHLQGRAQRLGGLLAEQLLKDLTIYRFKPADLNKAQASGFQPGAVTVTSRGVEITLAPIPR